MSNEIKNIEGALNLLKPICDNHNREGYLCNSKSCPLFINSEDIISHEYCTSSLCLYKNLQAVYENMKREIMSNENVCKDCIYYDPIDNEHGYCVSHGDGSSDPVNADDTACEMFSR